MREQAEHHVRGGRHAGVAEHGQRHRLRRGHQRDRRAGDDAERALSAGQEPGQIRAVLRQQVLQGVAGYLPGEPAELGADQGQVRRDQGVEPGADRAGRGQAAAPGAPRRQLLPRAGQHVQAHHVVGRTAVPQGPRAAGVVADRAADGGPRVGGRIGAEPQPVGGRGGGDVIQGRARFGDRGAGLRVHRQHAVQVPGKVQHDTGADRVARGGRAAAPAGERHAELRRDLQSGGRLVGVPGKGDHARQHAVVGRVGGILRPAAGRVVHRGQARGPQRGGQLTRRCRSGLACGHGHGHVTVTDVISPPAAGCGGKARGLLPGHQRRGPWRGSLRFDQLPATWAGSCRPSNGRRNRPTTSERRCRATARPCRSG